MSARFQCYHREDGWYWRLLGANNRTLGRSATAAADLHSSMRDAADLASVVPTARIDVVGNGRGWSWVLSDGHRIRAVSAGAYVRRLDCTRSIARFRASASTAELSDVVPPDRSGPTASASSSRRTLPR